MDTTDKVRRLVNFATGDERGDGMIVTAVLTGYAEPGYGSVLSDETPVIVLGDWNPSRFSREGEPPLTPAESLPARLADALERVGAEVQWHDEWAECSECGRAIRTQPDSYSWKPAYLVIECDYVCHDCALKLGEDALSDYVNNSDNAVTWCESSHLESFGYVKWEPHDPHTYESGWRPGQDAVPADILAEIHRAQPDSSVVFFIDGTGQFDIRFSAYVKVPESDD